jgi:hypothetical protein
MTMRILFLAVFVFSMAAFSQSLPGLNGGIPATTLGNVSEFDGVFQLRYLANLTVADSYINATNAGTFDGFSPAQGGNGNINMNVYAFDPAEEMISCCCCVITPNGLVSLSARNDLINNTLTGSPLSFNNGITVKLLASLTQPAAATTCDPATPTAANLVRGLKAWAITPHLNTQPEVGQPLGEYELTETEFAKAELSARELAKLTGLCQFIRIFASGFGRCRSCPFGPGAQGADIR